MTLRIVLGILIGGSIGGLIGYLGKCSSGACIFTRNPFITAGFGMLIGYLIATSYSTPSSIGKDKFTVELTDENFQSEVIESQQPVLVDFYADRCPACTAISPIIAQIAEEYKDKIKVGKLDVDKNSITTSDYYIRRIPTLLFFKDGKVIDQNVGLLSRKALKAKIEESLSPTKNAKETEANKE